MADSAPVTTRPEVPLTVVRKLIFFTAAMIIAPVSCFFILQNVFNWGSIVSGGTAALVANIVLIGYVVAAFMEDTEEMKEKKTK
uniref:ARAD1C16896p n=1 Tax=Blastobotrys adeninivorans TaxID=409370 RepID=A0A060T0J9_BLAAD